MKKKIEKPLTKLEALREDYELNKHLHPPMSFEEWVAKFDFPRPFSVVEAESKKN